MLLLHFIILLLWYDFWTRIVASKQGMERARYQPISDSSVMRICEIRQLWIVSRWLNMFRCHEQLIWQSRVIILFCSLPPPPSPSLSLSLVRMVWYPWYCMWYGSDTRTESKERELKETSTKFTSESKKSQAATEWNSNYICIEAIWKTMEVKSNVERLKMIYSKELHAE